MTKRTDTGLDTSVTDELLEKARASHDAILVPKDEYERLKADAERWKHCLMTGFPVRNQSARTDSVRWVAFSVYGVAHFGPKEEAAVDAARKARP